MVQNWFGLADFSFIDPHDRLYCAIDIMTNDDDICNDKEKKLFGWFYHFLAAAIDFFQYQN